MCQFKEALSKKIRPALLLSLVALSVPAAAQDTESVCRRTEPIEFDTTVRGSGHPAEDSQCFEVDVSSPGVLWIDTSVPGPATVEPRLDVLGRVCEDRPVRRTGFRYLERTASTALVEARVPGRYAFCVSAQDRSLTLGDYKVVSAFASILAFTGSDPDEDEPDPESLIFTYALAKSDPDEDEPDPESLVFGGATRTGGVRFEGVCRGGEIDDHGDTFGCASHLGIEQGVTGEISNSWGDDADIFTFEVTDVQTVELTVSGSLDASGALYHRDGYRLATAQSEGKASGFWLAKTLTPGRYFVLIEGQDGSEGSYRLSLATAELW